MMNVLFHHGSTIVVEMVFVRNQRSCHNGGGVVVLNIEIANIRLWRLKFEDYYFEDRVWERVVKIKCRGIVNGVVKREKNKTSLCEEKDLYNKDPKKAVVDNMCIEKWFIASIL